jgi:hypothetical protein
VHCQELLSRLKINKCCLCFTSHHFTMKRKMANKLLSCSFFSLDIFYKTFNILVIFYRRIKILTCLATVLVWHIAKVKKTLLKMDFKLRNRLKSKCVQFFDTPCSFPSFHVFSTLFPQHLTVSQLYCCF